MKLNQRRKEINTARSTRWVAPSIPGMAHAPSTAPTSQVAECPQPAQSGRGRSLFNGLRLGLTGGMARPTRADKAGTIDHALNRANLRSTIFHKDEDYLAFEAILGQALELYQIELYSYERPG